MLNYSPKTNIGKFLLQSIPRKVCRLLEHIGKDKREGSIGKLSWSFNELFTIKIDDAIIYCTGDPLESDLVYTNMPWTNDIERNIDKFVALERQIYDEFEQYKSDKSAST